MSTFESNSNQFWIMKKVEAIIRSQKFEDVKDGLESMCELLIANCEYCMPSAIRYCKKNALRKIQYQYWCREVSLKYAKNVSCKAKRFFGKRNLDSKFSDILLHNQVFMEINDSGLHLYHQSGRTISLGQRGLFNCLTPDGRSWFSPKTLWQVAMPFITGTVCNTITLERKFGRKSNFNVETGFFFQ